jgi:hypothetical protein
MLNITAGCHNCGFEKKIEVCGMLQEGKVYILHKGFLILVYSPRQSKRGSQMQGCEQDCGGQIHSLSSTDLQLCVINNASEY